MAFRSADFSEESRRRVRVVSNSPPVRGHRFGCTFHSVLRRQWKPTLRLEALAASPCTILRRPRQTGRILGTANCRNERPIDRIG